MTEGIRKEFILEGLECANCAVKIEDDVNKLGGVVSASINFANSTLVVEAENEDNLNSIIEDTRFRGMSILQTKKQKAPSSFKV